jgi:hypothetical protein
MSNLLYTESNSCDGSNIDATKDGKRSNTKTNNDSTGSIFIMRKK